MSVIPDPIEPYKRAIDGKTGEMLYPLSVLPAPADGSAPTAADLQRARRVPGVWAKPGHDHEWVDSTTLGDRILVFVCAICGTIEERPR